MTDTSQETWQRLVAATDVDPQGWLRIVLETSDDGETYDRRVIARGDDAIEVIGLLKDHAFGTSMSGTLPGNSCEDLHPGETHDEWNVGFDAKF